MSEKTQTFEQHMAELEKLVTRMEQGDVPLDEALKAFEQGMKLVAVCKDQLAQAEMKVEKVMNAQGDTVAFNVGE
jgi:exodeoxyribonuclease VII small subunit